MNLSALKNKSYYLFFSLPFLIFIAITGLNFRLMKDECFFYRIIESFPSSYLQAHNFESLRYIIPFPGYFIMQSFLYKLLGSAIWQLRMVNIILGFITIVIFFRIMRGNKLLQLNRGTAIFISLILLLNPYFFMTSYLIYSDILALCFSVLAVYFYAKNRYLVCFIFCGLAIFTRQAYLFLPIGFSLDIIIKNRFKLGNIVLFIAAFSALVLGTLFFVSLSNHTGINYFLIPSAFSRYASPNRLIISVGIYSLPLVIFQLPELLKIRNLLFVLALSPFQFINANTQLGFFIDIGWGVASNTIINITHLTHQPMVNIMFVLFWLIGAFVIAQVVLMAFIDREINIFYIQFLLAFIMVLFLTWYFSERYILLILPWLLILLSKNFKMPARRLAVGFVVFLYLLNITGFYLFVLLSPRSC